MAMVALRSRGSSKKLDKRCDWLSMPESVLKRISTACLGIHIVEELVSSPGSPGLTKQLAAILPLRCFSCQMNYTLNTLDRARLGIMIYDETTFRLSGDPI
jgi:hypothetical protein